MREANSDTGNPPVTSDKQVEENSGIARATPPKHVSPIVTVALIEASSKLFWPITLLLALVMFETPLYNTIEVLSKQLAGGGASVEIAGIKVNLPNDKMPAVPESIKNILPHLTSDDVYFIVTNYGNNNRIDICYHVSDPKDFNEDSVYSNLNKLGLISFERESFTDSNGKSCVAAAKVQLTPLYDRVREYLLEVLAAKFK